MKKLIYLFLFAFVTSIAFVGCDDEDDSSSPFKTVMLGAQDNETIDGFYSINLDKTYTLDEAASDKANIDLLCYYDAAKNLMTLASPGANLDGVFTGTNDPEAWNVADTTFFHQVDASLLTVAQFDLLIADSELIEPLFDTENAKRKAKELSVNDIYAFQTEDSKIGLFKVVSVTAGNDGFVEFTYILKE